MTIESEQQLKNTQHKLELLEQQLSKANSRPQSAGSRDSAQALAEMANQLREDIVRYRSRQGRRAS